MTDTITTADRIKAKCLHLANFLCDKNESYGDSALKPIGIFAWGNAKDNLCARIDDKLSRIKQNRVGDWGAYGEDTIKDLAGYLILLMLAREDDHKEGVDEMCQAVQEMSKEAAERKAAASGTRKRRKP